MAAKLDFPVCSLALYDICCYSVSLPKWESTLGNGKSTTWRVVLHDGCVANVTCRCVSSIYFWSLERHKRSDVIIFAGGTWRSNQQGCVYARHVINCTLVSGGLSAVSTQLEHVFWCLNSPSTDDLGHHPPFLTIPLSITFICPSTQHYRLISHLVIRPMKGDSWTRLQPLESFSVGAPQAVLHY